MSVTVTIRDDLGTSYRLRHGQADGSGTEWDATQSFGPRPLAGATELHLQSLFHNYNLRIRMVHNGKGLTQEQFEAVRYKKE